MWAPDTRLSSHKRAVLSHHSLWEPRDAKGAAGVLGEQRHPQGTGGWMSVTETQAAAHRWGKMGVTFASS